MITKKDVQHVTKLARLGLTQKEIEKFQRELSKILDYIEKLGDGDKSSSLPFAIARVKEVDISKTEPPLVEAKVKKRTKSSSPVEPTSHSITRALAKGGDEASTSSTEVENIMREDEVKSQKSKVKSQKLMELAPETKNGYLKTKPIL